LIGDETQLAVCRENKKSGETLDADLRGFTSIQYPLETDRNSGKDYPVDLDKN